VRSRTLERWAAQSRAYLKEVLQMRNAIKNLTKTIMLPTSECELTGYIIC